MSDPTFFVRDIPVYGDVILAPMAGYADLPQRMICRAYGSAMSYTEFVAAEEIVTNFSRVRHFFDFDPKLDRPMVFQIFSNSADRLLEAAHIIAQLNPDIIDINMGCSTRKVSGRGAGVGMMKQPLEVARTFELLTRELPMPITGKIRLGWSGAENYLEIGRIMQESGASLVAIHPRTKEQKYSGKSRWDAIAELKQSLSIPVIGNGDIATPDDIERMLAWTGCDAVMVGRGVIGNPWLLGRQSAETVTPDAWLALVLQHMHEMIRYHGERGLIFFRKHLKLYLKHRDISTELRRTLMVTTSAEELENRLRELVVAESQHSFM